VLNHSPKVGGKSIWKTSLQILLFIFSFLFSLRIFPFAFSCFFASSLFVSFYHHVWDYDWDALEPVELLLENAVAELLVESSSLLSLLQVLVAMLWVVAMVAMLVLLVAMLVLLVLYANLGLAKLGLGVGMRVHANHLPVAKFYPSYAVRVLKLVHPPP
jgi:hypothetical protein